MSVYTQLISKLLFPLHEALKGHDTVAIHRALERSQWWESAQLQAYQNRRLQALVDRARQRVPYYRHLWAEQGLGTVSTVEQLSALPFLTKALIREHGDQLKAEDARGLARFNTGGSSGEPLIFHIGKERVSHDVAAKWRATRWWGVDIGDPEIVLWGSPIELGAQDRLRLWRDRLLRTELLPAFEMSEAKLDEFLQAIRRRRPRMIFGYPSAMALVARHARRRGVVLNDLDLKVAFVTAERLYDDQAQLIGETFGCPLANGYGARDAGFIAHQCPEGGMHITAEDIVVEIIDAQGQVLPRGQLGEVVITHLATRDFPFIRYRTGDMAVLSENNCTCGRGLPLLERVEGRNTDFIVAPDGTLMHGLALIYVLRDLPGIEVFKIIQENTELIRVLLVTDARYSRATEEQIQAGIRRRMGETVQVQVEPVDNIPPERSGKYRYVVSRVMTR